MRTDPPPAPETGREKELRRQLQLAYEQLTEITSRLLLTNEAAEAALAGEDSTQVAERFLVTVVRGIEARRAAIFLVDGDRITLGAAFGFDADARETMAANDADLEVCRAAIETGRAQLVDEQLVAADARAALAAEEAEGAAEEADEESAEGGAAEEESAEGGAAEEESAEGGAAEEESAEESAAEEDEDGEPASFALYIPARIEAETVAVLALGERAGGRVYRQEDLVLLRYLLRQFALTLHRSWLLERDEERLEELGALLRVSHEITSTLDLDAVLRSVVNTVAAVVPNDRAEIALLRGGRLVLRAVSGMTRLDQDQAEIFKLTTVLDYLRTHPRRLHIGAEDLGNEPPPPGHDVFEEYFSAQPMRSFMALPLKDDQGLLGFLCLESFQEGWALHPAEGDTLSILAAQTTVAIRNATLYSEIPLRGVSRPVSRLRTRLGALTARGRLTVALVGAAVVLALLLPITPERAGGTAEVRPLRFQGVRALSEGVVARVFVAGGEAVRRGQALAVVEDLDLAGRIADLRAQAEGARRDLAAARLAGDVAAWRTHELRLAGLEGTLAVEEKRARGRALNAPLDGQVLELDLHQRIGQHLEEGESFCTVAALDPVAVDFEVAEEKVGGVRIGQPVAVKVMSFPTHTFRGRVIEVGWRGHRDARGRTRFTVRAEIGNGDRRLRPGMTGIAKASMGWRPAGALLLAPLFRGLQMWLW